MREKVGLSVSLAPELIVTEERAIELGGAGLADGEGDGDTATDAVEAAGSNSENEMLELKHPLKISGAEIENKNAEPKVGFLEALRTTL